MRDSSDPLMSIGDATRRTGLSQHRGVSRGRYRRWRLGAEPDHDRRISPQFAVERAIGADGCWPPLIAPSTSGRRAARPGSTALPLAVRMANSGHPRATPQGYTRDLWRAVRPCFTGFSQRRFDMAEREGFSPHPLEKNSPKPAECRNERILAQEFVRVLYARTSRGHKSSCKNCENACSVEV
ncbi:hypothetical protein ACVWWG_000093 [Bradyrhizobium sp. LB7.2]